MTVDIICSVLDGEPYLSDLLESLRAQTHSDWRLWVRDDGSRDATVAIITAAARRDSRIHLLHVGGPRLGVAGAFGWLLTRVPLGAEYVMCADADDVWLPQKIERTLACMREAERATTADTPVLVHTDLTVVDRNLQVLHPSFWTLSKIEPEPATLRRLAIRNVVTAPTIMLNGALRTLVGETPGEAVLQDWWYALVAAAFGRIVALRESTMLYRQHGANVVGAREPFRGSWRTVPNAVRRMLSTSAPFRHDLSRGARQASAFVDRYRGRLIESEQQFLSEYARIPGRSFLRRKLDLLRYRRLPEHGLIQTLGILLRG